MKVFVTGHKGYIGVHLVDLLKQSGYAVTGCDLGLFDGCSWEKTIPADQELGKDVAKSRSTTSRVMTALCTLQHYPMTRWGR